MKIKKTYAAFILCFVLVQAVMASKWETVSSGDWNSGGVWLGGVAPSYTSSDTFLIKHPVLLNATLILNAGANMQIDSLGGGICGHQKMRVGANAKVLTYGILEVDSLLIPGGNVNCLAPAVVILAHYGILSNGGSLHTNCSFSVGFWFNCHLPEYAFATGVPSENLFSELSVYPNPFSSQTTLHTGTLLNNATLTVYNSYGQEVRKIEKISGQEIKLQRDDLPGGLYFIRLTQGNQIYATEKLVITDK